MNYVVGDYGIEVDVLLSPYESNVAQAYFAFA
jgi:hypothetical protein